jgi:hypothetical protein
VLVSFFHFQINFYKDGKGSPTHSNLRTGMRKILTKSLILAWEFPTPHALSLQNFIYDFIDY